MLIEGAVPLVAGALTATGVGLGIALVMSSAAGASSAIAWAVVWLSLAGVAAAVGMIALSLPMVRRITETEDVRFE